MARLCQLVAALLTLFATSSGPILVQSVAPKAVSEGLLGATAPTSHDLATTAPDLPAMALTPVDLNAIGLTGFGQQTSALLTPGEPAAQVAPEFGMEPSAIQAALARTGFQRGYERQLGLPSRLGDPSSRPQTFVASVLLEYASVDGATTGFALLPGQDPEGSVTEVVGTHPIGDASKIRRVRRSIENGKPYRVLALTFRFGTLVAEVAVGEVGDRQPDLATVEALGERLLEKMRARRGDSRPGLSTLVLRLRGTDVDTRSDEYGRLAGETFPNFGETPDEFTDRAERYGDAVDVYGVGQSIATGGPTRTDDIRSLVLLFRFASEQDAAMWMHGSVERTVGSPNVITATPVDGTATIGEASLTLAMSTERGGAQPARGYLIAVQAGAQVAQIQLLGIPGVPLAAVEDLARAQAACLQSTHCSDSVSVPAGLSQLAESTPIASPVPSGQVSRPTSCAPIGPTSGTPAAVLPEPPRLDEAGAADGNGAAPPNIILILTDDLDAQSVACLPNVRSLLVEAGMTFSNAFVTTPLCCPSRASLLRGQYAHNHGVLSNSGEQGGFSTFYRLGNEDSTVATWLDEAGYRTALFGKYLNGYPKGATETHIPPGWDEWAAFASNEDVGGAYYYDYTLNADGTLISYGHQPADYSTDVLAAKAAGFLERAAASGDPFFLYLAPYAPHGPATPATRHSGAFADARAPRWPSFDEADVSDKPAWVQAQPNLSPDQVAVIDDRYQRRLRSLLAVDEMVASLIETLSATGRLDSTYIVLTSDNGYHLGEHRLPLGKQSAYDESTRVPLIVRGPGVPADVTVDEIALNIDLAPTFAELAGAGIPDFVDGRSLVPLLHRKASTPWRQGFLIELYDKTRADKLGTPGPAVTEDEQAASEENDASTISRADAPPYLGLRTVRYLYVEYDGGETELYDLQSDPYALENLARTADPVLLARLSAGVSQLRTCTGISCRSGEDALPAR